MDWTLLLAAGSIVRQEPHSNHRVRVRTSADVVVIFLLRFAGKMPSRKSLILKKFGGHRHLFIFFFGVLKPHFSKITKNTKLFRNHTKCSLQKLQILVFLFPAGLYLCFSKLTDANIFIVLYGITSIYFAVSHLHVQIECMRSNRNNKLTALFPRRYHRA